MKWKGAIDFNGRPLYDAEGLITSSEVDTISGSLQTNIDGKSDTSHLHDDRYYRESEVDTISGSLNAAKSDVGHSHTESDISNLDKYTQSEVDSLITTISGKLDDHNELNNLDYASAGHTGFQPAGSYASSGANSDITSTTALTQITRATGGAFDIAIGGAAGDDFTVDTNKLVVEGDTGRVGIGTGSPSAKLDLSDVVPRFRFTKTGVDAGYGEVYNDGNLHFAGDDLGQLNKAIYFSGNDIHFRYTRDASNLISFDLDGGGNLTVGNDLTVNTNKFVVESATSRVGIGTAAPEVELDITKAGTLVARVLATGSGNSSIFRTQNDAGSFGDYKIDGSAVAGTFWGVARAGLVQVISNAAPFAIGTVGAYNITFGTNNLARISILSGGNIGIGTATPGGKLCVNGGVTVGSDTDAGDNNLRVEGIVIASHDDIIATSAGVAASIATETTFVTTNGDSDLDNVTLSDGTEGQTKYIACVVEGNAADTWKITPANMIGGTQITFAGIGEGCILKMYSTGWIVVGNNGGVIS